MKPPSCDRSCVASTVSKSLAAQMCAPLSLVWLGDQHPPASCCEGEGQVGRGPISPGSGEQRVMSGSPLSGDLLCRWPLGEVPLMALTAPPGRQHSLARGNRQRGAGSTSARVTINLIGVNPSVGSRITPVTTRLARRLHLHRVSAADLQINATAGGTVSVPAPAGSREAAPPPLLPTPAAPCGCGSCQGQAGGDPATSAAVCLVG